jgi:hypothetical protein
MATRYQGYKLHESLGIRTSALTVLAVLPPLGDTAKAAFEALFCRPGSLFLLPFATVLATSHVLGLPFLFERAPVDFSQLSTKPGVLFKQLSKLWRRSQVFSFYGFVGLSIVERIRWQVLFLFG